LEKHARQGERLDLYLLGRAALIVRYGLSLATKDVDMVTRTETPELEAKARPFGLPQRGFSRRSKGITKRG